MASASPPGSQRWVAEEALGLLVSSVQEYAIFILDPGGYIATWNRGAERIKGYTAAEAIGRHFSIFYPPEDVASGKPAWELVTAERDGRFEDEGWRIRKDGSRFWANVVITALRDSQGILHGFGKVTRDLTDRREAEETARLLAAEQAARAAADKMQVYQRDLIAILGHDLRNCVSVVMTAGEVSRMRAGEEEARRRATQIVNTAKRMRAILHGVIDYTYAQREGVPIAVSPDADVHRACERVLAEFRVLHPGRQIDYQAEGRPVGEWDEARLEQVIQNLLGNALKHGAPDGPVALRWHREGDSGEGDLVLSVHNQGPPIAPDLLPHVFEPFRSGAGHGGNPGGSMGLGLFIVREIVRAHGGGIVAESTAGEGTTFTVRLPPRRPS